MTKCALYTGGFGTDKITLDQGEYAGKYELTENYESGGAGLYGTVDAYSCSKSPIGKFGWDGAAGAFVLVDVKNKISIFYVQHVVGFPKTYSRSRDLRFHRAQESHG